ncbi:MAG: hypothetical protein IJ072_01600, partial [Oscillospiraceae bacterium]|nr:hypothetical protein [Oscillospiraceae bacterium]
LLFSAIYFSTCYVPSICTVYPSALLPVSRITDVFPGLTGTRVGDGSPILTKEPGGSESKGLTGIALVVHPDIYYMTAMNDDNGENSQKNNREDNQK